MSFPRKRESSNSGGWIRESDDTPRRGHGADWYKFHVLLKPPRTGITAD
jgi:hypothetical protein